MHYHYVYRIDFLDTGEYYIGKHSTPNLEDGYAGSGSLLEGKGEQISRFSIVSFHNTSEEALRAEKELIGNLWREDPKCLNQMRGGKGGWEHYSPKGIPKSPEHREKIARANRKPKSGKSLEACRTNSVLGAKARRGQTDSEEVRRKRAESVRKATAGVPKPWLRNRYLIEGIVYEGVHQVIEKFGCTRQTVWARVQSEKFPDWRKIDGN